MKFYPAFAVPLVGIVILFVVLAAALCRGFDWTDEAFYLLSMENPGAYRLSSTLFGYALHPGYLLFGGSIAGLRIAGAATIAALGAGALISLARGAWPRAQSEAYSTGGGLETAAAVAAALPLVYFAYWWPMPSYNWLPLAGGLMLLIATGELLNRECSRMSGAVAAMAGIATLMGKAPAALLFAFVYAAGVMLLVAEPRQILRQFGYALASTVTLLLVIVLFLPLGTIFEQIAKHIQLFGFAAIGGRSLGSELWYFFQTPRGLMFLASVAVLLLCLISRKVTGPWPLRLAAMLSACAVAVLVWLIARHHPLVWLGHGTASVSLLLLAAWTQRGGSARTSMALGLFCLLPWAAAVGTSNELAYQTLLYAGIPCIVGLVPTLALTQSWPAVRCIVLSAWLFVPAIAVTQGILHPYRLATAIREQTEATSIRGTRLYLDSRTQRFVQALQDAGQTYGFCPHDPIVDLTGEMPGAAYILNGQPPGFPWLPGGMPSSETLARAMLNTADAETLRHAWLITGEGRLELTPQFVRSLGFDLVRDYEKLVELRHPIYNTPISLHRPASTRGPARC